MIIHVSIEDRYGYDSHHVIVDSVSQAAKLLRDLWAMGVHSTITWIPETAAELRRETRKGRFWASKLWHFGPVTTDRPSARAARRAWGRVVFGKKGGAV